MKTYLYYKVTRLYDFINPKIDSPLDNFFDWLRYEVLWVSEDHWN